VSHGLRKNSAVYGVGASAPTSNAWPYLGLPPLRKWFFRSLHGIGMARLQPCRQAHSPPGVLTPEATAVIPSEARDSLFAR
jgi:hypothetical protein